MTRPLLIRPVTVSRRIFTIPEWRPHRNPILAMLGFKDPDPVAPADRAFMGRTIYSDCVIDFRGTTYTPALTIKFKESVAFCVEPWTETLLYHGVTPVGLLPDGAHLCLVDYAVRRTATPDDHKLLGLLDS